MAMKPNPQCSNAACLKQQKEYILANPSRVAATKAKIEAEASAAAAAGVPLHVDNEWNISVVDDNEKEKSTSGSSSCIFLFYALCFEHSSSFPFACFPFVYDCIIFLQSSEYANRGLTRELPSANEFQKPQPSGATATTIDDLEDLRRQLDALDAN
ncbi:ubiquitin-like modifier-activating enzyme 5 [Hibiscus syriacus]|uniref:ubiquitin-like modifier-activating enzyme 5 n=1 Tax=Hibiscus syriacus TaxID=106335 RepID=UPI001922A906|nr:ubiquitin-like modifier-activating enzyme 5 [Hibiscus syriacus]